LIRVQTGLVEVLTALDPAADFPYARKRLEFLWLCVHDGLPLLMGLPQLLAADLWISRELVEGTEPLEAVSLRESNPELADEVDDRRVKAQEEVAVLREPLARKDLFMHKALRQML